MTPKALTVRPITQHVPPKPYVTAAYVWKCRSCGHTMEDDARYFDNQRPVLCDLCKEVMDLTPVKKDYHDGK